MVKIQQKGLVYYPPLVDSERFQLLVLDLLQAKLKIPLRVFGRRGQSQHGIDLFGLIPQDTSLWNSELRRLLQDTDLAGKYIVIQCKSRLESPITYGMIKCDYDKTHGLDFEVGAFVVATSAPRDADLQGELASKSSEMPKFKDILFWPDLTNLLELYPRIAGEFYGRAHSEKSPAILGIKNTFLGLPPEEAVHKGEPLIVELVDTTISSNGILAYRNTVSYLIDCLSTAITIIPKIQVRKEEEELLKIEEGERRRIHLLMKIDSIFREAFMRLLKKSFEDREWKNGLEIQKGITFCLEELKIAEDESIFSNWVGDLRAFYKEHLEVELTSLTRVSYDEGLYFFVVKFSELLTIPIHKALAIQKGLFTLEFGLNVAATIINEQIRKPRRFHTSEDDFSFPTPISIMVEPLMRGICATTELLSDFPFEPDDLPLVRARLEELATLLFVVLTRYRELNSETDINKSMLGSILSKPGIICTGEFSSKLQALLDYPEPRRFDYVIEPVKRSLRRNRELFDDPCLVNLFKASLASYAIQRPLYGRIRNELRELCVECIESVSDDNKPGMILSLAEELISPPEKNDDDSAVYGFQLLGRRAFDFDIEGALDIFREKIDSLKGIGPPAFLIQSGSECKTLVQYIYERNKEIANWKPPEEESGSDFFKPWRPVYKKWEVNSSKKVVEVFDQIRTEEE